jgi:hypothetical protein
MLAGLTLAAALGLGADPAWGQAPPARPAPPAAPAPQAAPATPPDEALRLERFRETAGAQETRMELFQLLRKLPPSVGEVLQRDPSLLQNADYLAAYPPLVAFLQQHPEVLRNPSFFFGVIAFRERSPSEVAVEMFEGILLGLAGLTAFCIVVSVIVWLVRTVIDHRRWLRLSRVQAEVHTKLLDRLTSNEDVLAYIQTPAGRRFLESAPITVEGEPRQPSAPLSRIIWSVQAGVVLFTLGVGLYLAQGQVPPEVGQGLSVIGTIVVALGVGFVASALLAYMITARFGLVPSAKPVAHE